MPIGIIVLALTLVCGGLCGVVIKKLLPEDGVDQLFITLAFASMSIGIFSLIKMNNMTAVILSLIAGLIAGELLKIDMAAGKLIKKMTSLFQSKNLDMSSLATAMAIFCFSGTGIYGALVEGMDGDSSILLAKAVLDFFTAMVYSAKLGSIVSLFAPIQMIILLFCFMIAKFVSPLLTLEAIANFKAIGGIMTIMIAYNILAGQNGWTKVRVLNTIPAFVFVVLLSIVL